MRQRGSKHAEDALWCGSPQYAAPTKGANRNRGRIHGGPPPSRCVVPELDPPTLNVRSIPVKAAAILASSSSGRDEGMTGPGVGTTVGECVGAGEGGFVVDETVVGGTVGAGDGESVGPGVGTEPGRGW